jgi:hypothetical protein
MKAPGSGHARARRAITLCIVCACTTLSARLAGAQADAGAGNETETNDPPKPSKPETESDILGGLLDPAKELEDLDVRELADRLASDRDESVRLKREVEQLEAIEADLREAMGGKGQRGQSAAALLARLADVLPKLAPPPPAPAKPDEPAASSPCGPLPELDGIGARGRDLANVARNLDAVIQGATFALYSEARALPYGFTHGAGDEYLLYAFQGDVQQLSRADLCGAARDRIRSQLQPTVADLEARLRLLEQTLADKHERLSTRLAAKKQDRSRVEFRIRKIQDALRARGSASTSAIAKLPWLVGLLGLFSLAIMVMVQRFRESIQKEWIASGQVIQFMTVTVLVTVVLILGLANAIRSEALGTLLGGVAGYVLSQGIARRMELRDKNARDTLDEDKQPGPPKPGPPQPGAPGAPATTAATEQPDEPATARAPSGGGAKPAGAEG